MMIHRVKILLQWDADSGGYSVIVPSLPNLVLHGNSYEHALEVARQSIGERIRDLEAKGKAFPEMEPLVFFVELEVPV